MEEIVKIEEPVVEREFGMRFSSTPRGARLARRLTAHRLNAWGLPYDSTANETALAIVAELGANAVQHGRVAGRDFHLLLRLAGNTVRVEVTDTRPEREPERRIPASDAPLAESGRGLTIVDCLADTWGWYPRRHGPGKTVWAQYVHTALRTSECHHRAMS
ncbi:ATP-binding protein [Streptomyces sp. NRRL F-5126]|uniref:ATP-binding protein n=1 Tax=Streptomyces sp. NRRL F-5126 TaxID=1463857 RepID=UPI00099BD220|nr:ATP-binding protein [Streptomyces sp. NRRL F-5126]